MKRTPLPEVLKDEALNRFITGVLLDAKDESGALAANMGNTLIERTVSDLRAFFPGAYTHGGDTGGNVHGGDVQQWPDRIGAA